MAFRRSRQDNRHRASDVGVNSWRTIVVVVSSVAFLLLLLTTTMMTTSTNRNNKSPIFCTASSVATSSPSPSSSSGGGWRRRGRFGGPKKDQHKEATELDNVADSKAKQPWWKIRSTTKSSANTKSPNTKKTDSKATKKEETKKKDTETAKKSDDKEMPKGKKETDREPKEDGSKPAKTVDSKRGMPPFFGLQKSEPKKDGETKDKDDELEDAKGDKGEPDADKSGRDAGKEDAKIDKSEETKSDSKHDTTTDDGPKDADDAKAKKKERAGELSPSSFSGLPPGAVIYRARPIPSSSSSGRGSFSNSPASPSDVMSAQTTALVAMTVVNAMQTLTRLWFLQWVARKIAGDSELMTPQQHFTWECLNDKYSRDEEIWTNVLTRKLPPASMQLGKREWNKVLKGMKPKTRKKEGGDGSGGSGLSFGALLPSSSPKGDGPAPPSKTVVLVELSTSKRPFDVEYLADVVTFLVAAHNGVRTKQLFGPEPEIVFNLESGGGEVTVFALAAAQLARLRVAGWKVTACINRIAASGGYMMASQATQIVAAPFAIVGSIGVIGGGLNFNKVLESYGVKAIEIKSGERKNPISQFASVTDKDIQIAQDNADKNHRDFINLCLARRPMLNEGACDGRIVNGDKALEAGLIDRILTTDEYIFEKIADGDLVMKLHRTNRQTERTSFAQALQILPHLGRKMKMFFSSMTGFCGSTFHAGTNFGGPQLNAEMVNKVFQGVAFFSMVHSALKRSGHFGPA